MEINTAEEAIEVWQMNDGWEFADREAAWKWMFEQGKKTAADEIARLRNTLGDIQNYAHKTYQVRLWCEEALMTPNDQAKGREPHSGEASPGATGSTTPGNHGGRA